MPRFVLYLCLSVFIRGSAVAAPPTVTYLHPAGAQRGATVEVTAAGTFDPWPVKVWASGKGVSIEASKDKGKLSVTVAKDAVPGVYWLRAFNDDGASTLRPFVVGTLPEVMEKEPNDEFKKPHAIAGNAVVNGKLEKAGDVDCFAVSLKKGQTLVASLEAHRTLRSPMDAILQVVSADGFVLDENHDYHGLDPQLAFTAAKDGTYVVRLFAFPSNPDSSIRLFGSDACVYRLTLTTGAFADFAVPLAVGPDAMFVEVRGWNIDDGKLPITHKPAPGETHLALFDPKLVNPVRVRVELHPTTSRAPFDPAAKPQPALTPPFSVTGRVQKPADTVRVAVQAKKGQALSIQTESRSLELAANPVITVRDRDGKELARAAPPKLHTDTTLSFNPPADGTYEIVVSDLYSDGGPRHVFLLRVLSSKPDYVLTVAADRFTIVPGKPTTIPVKINRKNGFTKPVEVVAEGLPEGVKLEVKEPAKPDSGTLTVELTADKPFSGPFRLVGKVKDEPELGRTARAPLAEFDESTADLWLTVAAPPKK